MRKILALAALLVMAFGLAIPAFAQERPNIPEWLADDAAGRFTTLVAALDAAGLTETLSGDGPFTVFAPTNDAFTAALETMGMSAEDVIANPDLLSSVLSYHVVPGRYQYVNLTSGPELETLEGSPIQIALDAGFLYANDAVISDPDGIASNGVVHVIDGVLLPPSLAPAAEVTEEAPAEEPPPGVAVQPARPSIVDTLTNDGDARFTTFLQLLDAAGLSNALTTGAGPLTVFAPTNEGVEAALASAGLTVDDVLADPGLLTSLVTNHLVQGRYQYINLTSGPELTSLNRNPIQLALDGGFLTANGVLVSDPDQIAGNGVIHTIDGALLPPSIVPVVEETTEEATEEPVAGVALERPDVIGALAGDADGRFTTLLAAIDAAGLTETLSGDGPFTIFAPSNDAFTAALETMGMSVEDVVANPDLLTSVVSFHVVPERLQYINLTGGPELTTLEGSPLQIALDGGILTANGVVISDPDLLASNGVVHVVDGVLLPPSVTPAAEATEEAPAEEPPPDVAVQPARPSIVDTLTNDGDARFSTFLQLLDAAGFSNALTNGAGPITVFAPTNDAIDATLSAMGLTLDDILADPALVTSLVNNHLLQGRYQYINLTSGPELTSLDNNPIQLALDGGFLTANGVLVSDPDQIAGNGVIHVIDGLLFGPDASAQFPAHVRVAHLSPDTGNVDVYVNGELVASAVPFSAVSEWWSLTAGNNSIAIVPAGTTIDDAVINVDVPLSVNSWTTIAAIGSSTAETPTLTAQLIAEDYSEIPEGNARVTVFHAIEGGPVVSVVANGATVVSGLQYPGSFTDAVGNPNDGAFTIETAAGTYDIPIVAGGTPILELLGTPFEAGSNYFIAVAGTVDSPVAVVSATPQ